MECNGESIVIQKWKRLSRSCPLPQDVYRSMISQKPSIVSRTRMTATSLNLYLRTLRQLRQRLPPALEHLDDPYENYPAQLRWSPLSLCPASVDYLVGCGRSENLTILHLPQKPLVLHTIKRSWNLPQPSIQLVLSRSIVTVDTVQVNLASISTSTTITAKQSGFWFTIYDRNPNLFTCVASILIVSFAWKDIALLCAR